VQLTPVERLILLKLTQILEVIDPAKAKQYDEEAQALELGTSAGLASLFEQIDLEPSIPPPPGRPILRLVSCRDEGELHDSVKESVNV
jgi:uncharacterized protein YfbU (UPF0304 family)